MHNVSAIDRDHARGRVTRSRKIDHLGTTGTVGRPGFRQRPALGQRVAAPVRRLDRLADRMRQRGTDLREGPWWRLRCQCPTPAPRPPRDAQSMTKTTAAKPQATPITIRSAWSGLTVV